MGGSGERTRSRLTRVGTTADDDKIECAAVH
jgi:hypothetical protein